MLHIWFGVRGGINISTFQWRYEPRCQPCKKWLEFIYAGLEPFDQDFAAALRKRTKYPSALRVGGVGLARAVLLGIPAWHVWNRLRPEKTLTRNVLSSSGVHGRSSASGFNITLIPWTGLPWASLNRITPSSRLLHSRLWTPGRSGPRSKRGLAPCPAPKCKTACQEICKLLFHSNIL